jgi:hypothetical protein
MTLLERTRHLTGSSSDAEAGPWHLRGLAAGAGVLAALASMILLCLPVLVAWMTDPRTTTSWSSALGVGVDGWVLAHGASLQVGAVSLRMMPLLLTAVPLLVALAAARQLLARLAGWPGATAGPGWRCPAMAQLTLFVLAYAVTGLLVPVVASGAARVSLPGLVPGVLLVPVVALLLGLWREHRSGVGGLSEEVALWLGRRTPAWLRKAVRPALVGAGLLLLAGLLVVVLVLVTHLSRIGRLYDELGAGVVGATVLSVGQALALPNLVLWALGWVAGPGFAVGDVVVTWTHVDPGVLPLVPVFGALPQPGALPPGLWLSVLVPVAIGGVVGWRSLRATTRLATWRAKARAAATACVLAAALLGALAALASGSLGTDHLASVGVHAVSVAGVLLLELLAGALLVVSVAHWRQSRL